MNQQSKQSTTVEAEKPTSKLDAFRLDFEYDKTLHEIRVITRKRAIP